jgi:outer membrane receptor protein involved in Fe transport
VALEEIVVTAQRREQSLQEVPISIEAISGAELQQWGHRDMDELANFTPNVTVSPDILRSSITVRGFGAATADALTIEQSSPTFVDGIHYGRTSQIKLAFLDLQSVEVLKGPQPVYFGQNAISGAFNLTTRKPTPTWEGYLDSEYSNNNTLKVEAAAGGPITDTLGIRVAGQFERSDGYLVDIISDGKFPHYKNHGGRVILQWTPTDNFQATLKGEMSDINKGAEGSQICFREGKVSQNMLIGTPAPQAVLLDPPAGVGWDIYHKPLEPCGTSYSGNDGIQIPTGTFPPPDTVYERTRTILVHTPPPVAELIPRISSADGFRQDNPQYSFESRENMEPWNLYLDLQYTLDNGIVLNSLTGYDYYYREYLRDNRGTPFFANFQNRGEDQYSISQELRVTSPSGGVFEWMVGGYYQDVDYDIYSDSIRPNTRTPRRYNEGYEDATWKSVFGTLTYNFLDGRASIDLGARYQNSEKETHIKGYGAEWIQSDGFVIPYNTRVNPTTNPQYMIYQGDIPIGMTPLREIDRILGPHTGTADQTELNPQITLRYRPTDDHTIYAKYAESFKAAGFNTGQATIPAESAYSFGPEFAENWEIGAKGTFLDGRARYNVTAFHQVISDLQLAEAAVALDPTATDTSLLTFNNAGAQRNRGVEFGVEWLATDNLSLSLNGAIMDGVMLDYLANCTEFEFEFAGQTGCDDDPDSDTFGMIDRSGRQAPNTPDYKFVLQSRYTYPLQNGYALTANAKGYISDGYFADVNSFTTTTRWERHGDLNVSLAFGPQGGPWRLTAFARNLLEPRQTYHPEEDFSLDNALSTGTANRNDFTTYGMKFRYDYN